MITQIGKSRVKCGDIYDNLDELFNGEKADIYYSDPPWGEGNLKYWQTMNKKMTGAEPKEVNLDKFLNRVLECSTKYTKDTAIIFIEYGLRWNNDLIELAKNYDLKCVKSIELLYGSKNLPNILNIFVKGNRQLNITDEYVNNVYHKKGIAVLENAITPFIKENDIVCDLCCGLGYTAQFSVNHKLKFIGNELNQARLNKTIEKLNKGR